MTARPSAIRFAVIKKAVFEKFLLPLWIVLHSQILGEHRCHDCHSIASERVFEFFRMLDEPITYLRMNWRPAKKLQEKSPWAALNPYDETGFDTPCFQNLNADLEGLADLCRVGLLIWSFEPDYGNKPPVKSPDCGEESFLQCWREFIEKSDLSVQVPDSRNPTLSLEGTPALNEEVDKDSYDEWRREIRW